MPAKALQIAAAQLKRGGTLPQNVELICRIIAEATRAGSDVVLFPNALSRDIMWTSGSSRAVKLRWGLKAVSEAARAHRCHNQVFYVFANSVGPQGRGLWSAGDSKIIAPDSRVLARANNRDQMLIHARLDLSQAGRKYAREEPAFLRDHWKAMLAACRRQFARTPSHPPRSSRGNEAQIFR